MITLTLLHPIRLTPIQSWEFSEESPIKIGRAPDNDVVLYSSVVSRYHLQLQHLAKEWQVMSQGSNGTYVDGKLIRQIPALHNTVMHLAPSGPKILLRLGAVDPRTLGTRVACRGSERHPGDNLTTAIDRAARKNTFHTLPVADSDGEVEVRAKQSIQRLRVR